MDKAARLNTAAPDALIDRKQLTDQSRGKRIRPGSATGIGLLTAVAYLVPTMPGAGYRVGGLAAVVALLVGGLPLRLRAPDLLAFGIAVWAYITQTWATIPDKVIWTADLDKVLPKAYLYAAAALLFVAVRQVVRTRRQLAVIGVGYLVGCVVLAYQLVQEATSGTQATRADLLDFSVRYSLPGASTNYIAYSMVIGVVLALIMIRTLPFARLPRIALLACVPLFVVAVILTSSRGATIALALVLAYLGLSAVARHAVWRGLGVLAPTAVVTVSLGLIPYSLLGWLDGLLGKATGDLSGRLQIWPYALSTWMDSPWLGNGAGTYQATNPYGIGTHNILLNLGNDLGLVGVLLFLATVAVTLTRVARRSMMLHRLAGVFLVALLPIWLSGEWETSPSTWLVLGLLSSAATVPATAAAHRARVTPRRRARQGPQGAGLAGSAARADPAPERVYA
ncbi:MULTISPECIES: O-antigen ligase family protein [unclassified Micromonospora]|uniref:O-antigen ligase family protein n=1 Tax=unclassified Micromonospora TaxID=2617518 RepID=UPI00363CEE01